MLGRSSPPLHAFRTVRSEAATRAWNTCALARGVTEALVGGIDVVGSFRHAVLDCDYNGVYNCYTLCFLPAVCRQSARQIKNESFWVVG